MKHIYTYIFVTLKRLCCLIYLFFNFSSAELLYQIEFYCPCQWTSSTKIQI